MTLALLINMNKISMHILRYLGISSISIICKYISNLSIRILIHSLLIISLTLIIIILSSILIKNILIAYLKSISLCIVSIIYILTRIFVIGSIAIITNYIWFLALNNIIISIEAYS